MKKRIKEKISGCIGSILILCSLLLPYYDFEVFTCNLYSGQVRYVIIAIALAGALFALTEVGIVQIAVGLAGILFVAISFFVNVSRVDIEEYLDIEPDMVSLAYGAYVMLVGAILLVMGGFLCIYFHKKEKKVDH